VKHTFDNMVRFFTGYNDKGGDVMADLETLYRAVDELGADELEQLSSYIEQRRRRTWWVIPPKNLEKIDAALRQVHKEAAHMTEDEINVVIDEALDEVRRAQDQGRD
jgi:hypothetical protein